MINDPNRLDCTVEGGAYIKGGQVVDAFGNPKPGWTVVEGVATPPPVPEPKSKKSQQDQVS